MILKIFFLLALMILPCAATITAQEVFKIPFRSDIAAENSAVATHR